MKKTQPSEELKVLTGRHRPWIALLFFSLLFLIVLSVFGSWLAPLLGDLGIHLRHALHAPLFKLGSKPVTTFFLMKVAIFLMGLSLVAHSLMQFLQKRVLIHTPLAVGQQYAVARVISYLVFTIGVVIGLESLGLNLSSLLVVGGALGLGVGLGLQPIVTNFVAGLILLLEQPIRLGDRIQVGETYGDVIALKGRSTWVQTNDNVVIIVPNSEFIESRVTNWTVNDRQVRIAMQLGVTYSCDPKVVREILVRVAEEHPDVLELPVPEVVFLNFGDSSLDFELRIWTINQVQTPSRLKSDLYFAIFDALGEAGIEIPFPQRDLHLRSISDEAAKKLVSAVQKQV
ncbi:MAG: mechanosensitive ion channel family protein [Acidobacteriaceae bacterium]